MKEFVDKYHLKAGFIVAAAFPGIFVFSEPVENIQEMLTGFFSFFTFIFLLWIIDFTLVDFKSLADRQKTKHRGGKYLRIVATFVAASILYLLIGLTLNPDFLNPVRGDNLTSVQAWFYFILRLFLFNILILMVKFLFDINEEKQQIRMENELLKRENLQARHQTLKQQVTPHFLFNSLNTLRSLIRRDAEKAEEFANELSAIYRYMLRHREKSEVQIQQELAFATSYLSLLKIRFEDSLYTDIEIPDSISGRTLPPLTLQLLIENAVKHNKFNRKTPLIISIYSENGHLVVKNNLQSKEETESSSQVGLENINSRYKLLKKREIVIHQDARFFTVFLPL